MSARDKGDHEITEAKTTDQQEDGAQTDDLQADDLQADDRQPEEAEASASEASDEGAEAAQPDEPSDALDETPAPDEAPVDEPTPPAPVAQAQADQAQTETQTRSSSAAWIAVLVAVVGSVGAATISSWGPNTIGYPRPTDDSEQITALEGQLTDLSARIEALQAELVPDLEARLGELEGRPLAEPDRIAGLAGEIEALAGDVAAQADVQNQDEEQTVRLDDLDERITGLNDRIGGIEGGLANIEGRVSNVQAGLESLEGQFGETSQTLSSIDSGLKANASAVLSVDAVAAAIDQGEPFAGQMTDLAALADSMPELADAVETLGAHADGGLTPRRALIQAFPTTARAIRTSLRAPDDDSLLSRTLAQVTSLVDVRPSAETAPDADGSEAPDSAMLTALTDAETRLAADDLAAAAESLGSLEGPAAEAAAPWLSDANALLVAEQALDRLRQAALIRLGRGAG